MKRMTVLFLFLVLAISLCGCSSTDYNKATELYNAEEYLEASTLFEQLGDYKDSKEMVKECNYLQAVSYYDNSQYDVAVGSFDQLEDYKDSAEYATDCHFLEDIAESVLNRREQNAKNTDYTTLTNTELAYLDKYRTAVFHDSGLQKLAKDYLDGLDDQKAALKLSYSEYQIAWESGRVERCKVLKDLSEKYGLLQDDKEFIATYVTKYSEDVEQLKALKAIDKDLDKQLNGATFSKGSYYCSAPYTNNTSYTFDILIYITYYKADRNLFNYGVEYSDAEYRTIVDNSTRVGESTNPFNSIKPKSTTTLKLYMPSSDWNVCEFYWTINNIS